MAQWLVNTRRSIAYHLVYRVVSLVLTLPVSTATTERAFSTMKIVKTRLRNRMEDDFLTDSLIMYIEKEIVEKISIDSIIDDFRDMQTGRVAFCYVYSVLLICIFGLMFCFIRYYVTSLAYNLSFVRWPAPVSFKSWLHLWIPWYGFGGILISGNHLCVYNDRGLVRILMMKEYGVMESWTEVLYLTFHTVPQIYEAILMVKPLWILENGDVLAYTIQQGGYLSVYKPNDKAFTNVIRPVWSNKFEAVTYRETLVSPITGSLKDI